jgi:hypothetical protein
MVHYNIAEADLSLPDADARLLLPETDVLRREVSEEMAADALEQLKTATHKQAALLSLSSFPDIEAEFHQVQQRRESLAIEAQYVALGPFPCGVS